MCEVYKIYIKFFMQYANVEIRIGIGHAVAAQLKKLVLV